MKKTFAVLGGDRRQIELTRLLARDGQQVFTCALGLGTDRPLETAGKADVAVLPMPLSKEPGLLNGTKVELGRLWELLRPEQLLCAGQVEEGVLAAAQGRGLTLVDYLKREELAVANAVPTAEGAVQLAMEQKGERIACLEMRRHYAWYLKGVPYASYWKGQISQLQTADDVYRVTAGIQRDLN